MNGSRHQPADSASTNAKPMRVLLAHPGTQHAYHLARELDHRGLLDAFWTGFALREGRIGSAIARAMSSLPQLAGVRSRIVRDVDPSLIHTLVWNELRALRRLRAGGESHAVLHQRNAVFQSRIPDRSIAEADAVIAFDTSAWILGQRAAHAGKPLFLDRTIAHPAAIARAIADVERLYPEWGSTAAARPDYVAEAEEQEHATAKRIVVGCSYAARTLCDRGVDPKKVVVNPYGVDWSRFSAATEHPRGPDRRPFRFLFVGSILARKGIPILIDAWRKLSPRDAELWVVGGCGARERALIPELPGLRVVGRLPHSELPRVYGETDVFVFPSVAEGFGLVLLEAVAAGLPVIATTSTGAVDFVTEPVLGSLVPPLSVDALAAAMKVRLENPPDRTAVRTAAARLAPAFSWEAYGDRWASLLSTAVN